MPIYCYVCPQCDHEGEAFCHISDRKKQHCPECGALMILKPTACAGIIMK